MGSINRCCSWCLDYPGVLIISCEIPRTCHVQYVRKYRRGLGFVFQAVSPVRLMVGTNVDDFVRINPVSANLAIADWWRNLGGDRGARSLCNGICSTIFAIAVSIVIVVAVSIFHRGD